MSELDSLGVEDLYDILEIVLIDAYNQSVVNKRAQRVR